MSTLTKVLIVLLTVFSIFLCGIVVTYVANADNYKDLYDSQRSRIQSATSRAENADATLKDKTAQFEAQLKTLQDEASGLQQQITALQAELVEAKRLANEKSQRVESLAASLQSAEQSATKITQLFEEYKNKYETVSAAQIQQEKELNETNRTLLEKMAVIAQMTGTNKRLVEEKRDLEEKLNALLRQYGKAIATPKPVTPLKSTAVPTQPLAQDIGLKGRISDIDLPNKVAQISIGAANGVKQDMKFHVTRGDQFICDLLILDVAPDKAIGILERIQSSPKVGDNVTTNL